MRGLKAMKKKLFIIIAAVIAVVLLASALFTGIAAKRFVKDKCNDIAGLSLEIGDYHIRLGRASLKLEKVKIYPAGKKGDEFLLASADEFYIDLSPMDLLHDVLHAKHIILMKPKINYIVTSANHANWDALELAENKDKDKSVTRTNVVIDDVEIKDGDVLYWDKAHGHRLELQKVNIAVSDIKKAEKDGDLPTSFSLEAGIARTSGQMTASGKADVFGDGISFVMDGRVTPTPLGIFSSYYSSSIPFQITGGSVSVSSKAKAVKNVLTSSHHVTIDGLKAGGGLKGELVNRFILSQAGPIPFDVSVNGNLSNDKFSVSASLSKEVADQLIARAMAYATPKAISAVENALPSAGKKAVEGFKGLFKKR
jgi:uncharacterized protein involved in outer membrane biogenesis